jgi:CheY-like chemotaxis protein
MSSGNQPAERKTILLVDDEQAVRSIVLRILRRANYDVVEAEDGAAAIRIAESHSGAIDLVVTDMFMPGMMGPEMVRKLMVMRPGIRALFMSGYADKDSTKGVPSGANFLGKPFSSQELGTAVEAALAGPPVS